MNQLNIRILSSAEKCFWNEKAWDKPEYTADAALLGERFQLELAIQGDGMPRTHYLSASTPLGACLKILSIEDVPVKSPRPDMEETDFARNEPGLYPDPLLPLPEDGEIWLRNNILSSYLVDVDVPASAQAGVYPITFTLKNEAGEVETESTFHLEVLGAKLPDQKLIYAHWVHYDCLADWYEVPVFSEKHWKIIKNYLQCAKENGVTAAFVPLFTPPLDTKIGGERPTVQLVDVTLESGEYRFGYKRLRRFIRMCKTIGFTHFELSHLFTQWGAKHAPKIMVTEDGVCRKKFGWETDATSPEYVTFLRTLLPDLMAELEHLGVLDRCLFHISDEPNEDNLESYTNAKNVVADLLAGRHICDALSHFPLYQQGAVERPIVAIDAMEPFLEAEVPHLWGYHCIAQWKKVSNRFIAMPMSRTRIVGAQMYKYRLEGFLQWGFNFWYSQYSTQRINPFLSPSGGFFTYDGDTCGVYPGPHGMPIESLHMRAFTQALTDLRAMELAESLCGREAVLAAIEADMPITFKEYPRNTDSALTIRQRVNQLIAQALK
ncbi:MAG: DUF4091 domain-containing protein [Clostridia bacterium]|nr:DUF4091 domain-containing protein [Clostridia bacterium]